MLRALLLAALVLAVATGCAGTGSSQPAAQATPSIVPVEPPASRTPTGLRDITPEEAARIAPLAPAELVAAANGGRVQLSWPSTGEDIAYYRCLRRSAAAANWRQIGQVDPATISYVDSNPDDGAAVYGVQAVNAAGTASSITESRAVRVGR